MTPESDAQAKADGSALPKSFSRSSGTEGESPRLLQSPKMSTPAFGIVICLAGVGVISIFYQMAIYFIHPDTALWLCVLFTSTGVVLVVLRVQTSPKQANPLQDEMRSVESRRSKRWNTGKPWIVLALTVCLGVPLVRSIGAGTENGRTEHIGFAALMVGLYLALWMLVSHIARRINYGLRGNVDSSTLTDAMQRDWKEAPWWAIGFFMGAAALPQGNQNTRVDGKYDHVKMVPYTKNSMLPIVAKRSATLAYWQAAVTNLHLVRFQVPSGQEPAETFYARLFQQLQQQTEAAKRAPTANVDVELVQMVARHLVIETELLQLKDQLDEYMKKEKLALPADTIEQRMAFTELLARSIHADPDVLEKIPAGPIREWIKRALRAEELRQQQFREIELMQAVLQERYKGTLFPLPMIDN